MTSQANKHIQKLTAIVSSRGFFVAVMVLFVLQATWIALSGRYPMAFDEDFHLGIIRLYAHHISPFWSGQPIGADTYGAVARDPSYLYQYLMSFPYRLIAVFTNSQTIEVLCLRGINIALFAGALPLYRRLLLRSGASRALVHMCLAVFVLIPIVPLLGAQINYDNLLLPLTALVLLITVKLSQELKQYQRINVKLLLYLLIVGLLTCLVKYAFLPMLLVVGVFLLIRLRQTYPLAGKFWLSLGFGWTLMTRRTRWLLLIALILVSGLFAQRYGSNMLRYHKPVPDCSQVLNTQRCSAYGPWIRDYNLQTAKQDAVTTDSPLVFTADWFYGMWLRTFFAVDGPATDFQTRGPFVMPAIGAIVFAATGLLAALAYSKRLFRMYDPRVLWLFVTTIAGYVAVLWLDEYQSFLRTGQAVAINGRYLLPIMPLFILFCALGLNELLKRRSDVKLAIATLVLVCMLWGGGALTYILRSSDVWHWPAQPVYDVNHAVQRVLGPVTPGYSDPTAFMGRN